MALPEIGSTAPDFSTVNQRGETISLQDFRGQHLIVYFYPKAMTPGCTTQACGIRDIASELAELNAVAVGISPDDSGRLQRFDDKYELGFDLLADTDHSIAEAWGVWGLKKFMGKEYMGVNRMTFIVAPDGTISHVLAKVKTTTHHDDVLALLRAAS
ncbi:thioredoxin-dependent thiol peroxidase [Parathalassolituus penaei]|uniref:thioredoxin-dependent peroxiredoxin n=1 Tax=Parathalassolituus penaei TaxID=2997323 RepID=A0A9X3ECK6_9GAMM|nr:thioredoxin-dependent thiol peroxidase [Parathalassolituus penaei]MCY0965133.1 thioredoxin-dependent thiol peroxidase [Parathalassolituus penaei]